MPGWWEEGGRWEKRIGGRHGRTECGAAGSRGTERVFPRPEKGPAPPGLLARTRRAYSHPRRSAATLAALRCPRYTSSHCSFASGVRCSAPAGREKAAWRVNSISEAEAPPRSVGLSQVILTAPLPPSGEPLGTPGASGATWATRPSAGSLAAPTPAALRAATRKRYGRFGASPVERNGGAGHRPTSEKTGWAPGLGGRGVEAEGEWGGDEGEERERERGLGRQVSLGGMGGWVGFRLTWAPRRAG